MIIAISFLRCTCYLNLLKDPINHVLLLIPVYVLLLSCIRYFLAQCNNHVIICFETFYERDGKNSFWYIKDSGKILNKLKSKGFLASAISKFNLIQFKTHGPYERCQFV